MVNWNSRTLKKDRERKGEQEMQNVLKEIQTVGQVWVRPMKKEEHFLLEGFLYDAIFQQEGSEALPKEVIQKPELAVYIQDFGKPDDVCMVAESEGKVLGAVWSRILCGEPKGYGNIDEFTPELAISVKKEFRKQGIGKKLMLEILASLRQQNYKKVSLSVNKDNYAFRMYQELGFQVVMEQEEDNQMILSFEK